MTTLNPPLKARYLLYKCLAVSIALHMLGLLYFYTHPIILHHSWKSLFGFSSTHPHWLEYEEEETSLETLNKRVEEAFEKVEILPHHLQAPFDLIELPQGIALSPTEEEALAVPISVDPTDLQLENLVLIEPLATSEELLIPEELDSIEPLFVPEHLSFEIISQLDIDRQIALDDQLSSATLPLDQSEISSSNDLVSVNEVAIEPSSETDPTGVNILDRFPNLTSVHQEELKLKTDARSQLGSIQSGQLDTSSHLAPPTLYRPSQVPLAPHAVEPTYAAELPEFESYGFPALATASQWNDDFDIQLQFFPKEEGGGYAFAVSLTPTFDVSQHTLKQNIYFILDRSNSVQKHRFAVFKRAVVKALASMQAGDCFNIYVVDKKIVRMSPTPLAFSNKTLRAAEEFLEKQEAGGHFNTADIYSTLEKLLAEITPEDAIDTAILLTDGSSLLSTSKQQQLLTRWIDKNSGKLSLYTAAVGQKNNLVMLDLLSSISGGKLLYSDTHASFPRKLAKLILDLQDPIASDLIVSAIPDNPHAHIEITTASTHFPTLYSRQPYVIVGTIDEPCNFDLIIQGRHGEEWISIKKNLSFIEGEKATRSQARQWESKEANTCYSQFLKEGKSEKLKEAKKILQSTRTEIAFE